jgi:predicted amidophosphoribosyltransferase
VCTTGLTLNAMAGFLVDEGGAIEVRAVVLARVPWGPTPPILIQPHP